MVQKFLRGATSSASFIGNIYYEKPWISFMKTKAEVFSRFQEFKALVENQTRKKIKVLRSENWREYTSNVFNDSCKDARIKREFIVLYNPQ